jgi:hypothetical protein
MKSKLTCTMKVLPFKPGSRPTLDMNDGSLMKLSTPWYKPFK